MFAGPFQTLASRSSVSAVRPRVSRPGDWWVTINMFIFLLRWAMKRTLDMYIVSSSHCTECHPRSQPPERGTRRWAQFFKEKTAKSLVSKKTCGEWSLTTIICCLAHTSMTYWLHTPTTKSLTLSERVFWRHSKAPKLWRTSRKLPRMRNCPKVSKPLKSMQTIWHLQQWVKPQCTTNFHVTLTSAAFFNLGVFIKGITSSRGQMVI